MSNDGTGDGAVPRGRLPRAGGHRARRRSSTCSPRTAASRPGPSELARRLGLPKSSIANICGALADAGSSGASGPGSRWAGGSRSSAARTSTSVDLVQEFYEACNGAARPAPRRRVQLAILDGIEMTYLARHDGKQPVRLTSQIGRRLPASVTADRQGRARVSSTRPTSGGATTGAELPVLHRDARSATVRRARRRARGRPRTGATRWTTRRPSRASSASASRSRAGVPARARTRRASRC